MKQLELTIQNPTGLHARPAKEFVTLAKRFQSAVTIYHGEKQANAKSLLSVLALGVHSGEYIRVVIDGADEEAAAEALARAVREGLGEDERLIPPEAPPAAPVPTPAAPDPEPKAGLRGFPAAPGIAIGPAFRLVRTAPAVDASFSDVPTERARLQDAIRQAQRQLTDLRDRLQAEGRAEAGIFDVHLELLEDPDLLQAVAAAIAAGSSAGVAWQDVLAARAAIQAALENPLLAARAADLDDLRQRVLANLQGGTGTAAAWPDHTVILLADDLSPSDTATLDRERVLGFCTAGGGPTSHSAIIARALGLPAVVSTGPGVLEIPDGTMLILDGHAGTLAVDPGEEELRAAQAAHLHAQAVYQAAVPAAREPAVTRDGHRVEVVANVGGAEDAHRAVAAGAEGIGLLRTEFLFIDRTAAPSEEEQYGVYHEITHIMGGRPVIVRTLDIGGDKPLAYVDHPTESNPFLGERGIRLCLARPELLQTQLRAILRSAREGHVRIMFPMVANLAEFRAARAMVEEIRAALGAPAVEIGIMVEVPSAALTADAFSAEVDFFSIGTNDLTQYTLAADRLHPGLAAYMDGLHPAVLKLIDFTVQAAHRAGKWVGVCGELAADPQAAPILIGLGVDELSVSPPVVATLKEGIRSLNLTDAQSVARRALACASPAEVRALALTSFGETLSVGSENQP